MRLIIRAVKDRFDFIEYLKKHLPQAEWCFDTDRNAMTTFLAAMRQAGQDAVVHMEEDILITHNFYEKLLSEIVQRPNEVIQFFSMRKADLTVGSRYDTSYMMNQCVYFPAGYSALLLDYYHLWGKKAIHPTGTDIMINDFLRSRKEKYWIHVPNLVEHRIAQSRINPRRSSKRQSKTFKEPV